MDELRTIQQVSRDCGISARMLRYYEKIGLIESLRREDYAYRVYDETTLRRIQHIMILRKLRVSMKQIAVILAQPKATEAIEIFKQHIGELDEEIHALSVIRGILSHLAEALQEQANIRMDIDMLMDSSVLSIVDALSLSKNRVKEKTSMEELHRADEKLSKLSDRDVRILYLPPATVASAHMIGGNAPELETDEILEAFVEKHALLQIKPDARHYGFNSPNGSNDGMPSEDHGYERWITIPDDLDVTAPLTKKHFPGGLYAAHGIMLGEWDRWSLLWQWIENSERFDFNFDNTAGMDGMMEEHLNPQSYFKWRKMPQAYRDPSGLLQIDLLIPIKEKGTA